jgi:hypothetical protein
VQNTPLRPVGPGGDDPSSRPGDAALTILTCVMLVLFGMAQALVGTFFYGAGPTPFASIGFDLAILATCLLGGWGVGRPFGAVAPAGGWFGVAFVLASGTGGGSVLITASAAGEWFLFGGAACATAGMIAALTIWSKFGRRGSSHL